MSTQVYWTGNVRITQEAFHPLQELSELAQQKAWERHWLDGSVDYPWSTENAETLKEFCHWFNVEVIAWEYGGYRPPSISYRTPQGFEYELYDLEGIRLWKYLKRDFGFMTDRDWSLTGFHLDEVILEPIREFLERPSLRTRMDDLIRESLDEWVLECHSDFEAHYSFENFVEQAEALGWLFTADGEKVAYDRD